LHLKRIKLYGFKSFADRTELELDPKLLAIVGPNGCGKSNIVDAILWGLGEHNPRALRAANAADVIFSGSARRKGLGYAEVQLTFDNEDGNLSYPAPEVVVTRRVTLDGEGEYYVNGKACRQKDVVDLFADTGLGRTGYAIVSQSEVDAILSAQPEQRRLLIDEAAGVQRFRVRKADTVKRLDAASQHLRRAQDLVDEIDRQIAPLEEQAMAARAYRNAKSRLDGLELGLSIRDLVGLNEALAEAEREIKAITDDILKTDRLLGERERQSSKVGASVAEADKELDHRRNLHQGAFTGLERADSAVALAIERLRALEELLQAEEERMSALGVERERLGSERAALAVKVEELAKELQAVITIDGSGAQALRESLETKRAEWTAARDLQLQAREQEVERRQAVLALTRLRDETAEEQRKKEIAAGEVQASEERKANCLAVLEQAEVALSKTRNASDDLRERRSEHLLHRAEADRDLAALQAKAQTLLHALPDDAGAALLGEGDLPIERLAARLDVAEEHRVAVDAALGPLAGILIGNDLDTLAKCVTTMADSGGRGAVIAREKLLVLNGDFRARCKDAGALGVAADFVSSRSEDRDAVEALLGRIPVAKDWHAAMGLADTVEGWTKVVTLRGETLHPAGAVEAGSSRGRVVVESELRDLAQKAQDLEETVRRHGAEIAAIEGRLADNGSELRALESAVVSSREEVSLVSRESEAAKQRLLIASKRVEEMEAWIMHLGEQIAAMPETVPVENIGVLENEVAELERAIAAAEATERHEREGRQALEKRLHEERERLARLEDRIASSASQEDTDRQKLMELARQLERLEAEKESAELSRARALETRQTADDEFERARLHRSALLEQSFGISDEVKTLRRTRDELTERMHQTDLDRAKADIRRAQLLKTLAEEREISMQQAIELAETIELPPEAAAEAAALRREIRRLGEVNLGAMEALESMGARRDDLVEQRDDLLEAQSKLLESMREIEDATKERFLTTFGAVQAAFADVFATLFEGGGAAIRLSHPDQPMTSGIEIDVQLPGKKQQRMELLSGGERSLTAVAFLFSLLAVRPSPLCILDEVDAALDGRNVERFCELVKAFAEKMQFLIVTHNAVTIEAAHIWYGVTMQEPGVSTVIPFGQGARAVVEPVIEATV